MRKTTSTERWSRFAVLLLAGGATCALPESLGSQIREDSVVVRAGARYGAGGLERRLLGEGYRDLWVSQVRVPLLRPDTFAGGLSLLQRGGGLQTASLRFAGEDGRQYVFRSVDKNQAGGLHPDLQRTLVSRIVQDQVSGKHPGAALVLPPILEAAGVLHVTPRLAVMADHPGLGEFRDEFAGMLGMIEERPEESDENEGFPPFGRVIGTERLLERVEASSMDRVDARAFLRARLIDLLVGDWDRHPDQWRWAEEQRGSVRYWIPIPRDRDNAFSRFGGLVGTIAGVIRPNLTRFDYEYGDVAALTHNAQALDRRLLAPLARPVWDSLAAEIQSRVTDEVIEEAVARLPPSYRSLSGEDLAVRLRYRRALLREAASNFYDLVAREVEIYATDEPDAATAEHLGDGRLRVVLTSGASGASDFFERTFDPDETREVRIHLRGGDDSARVFGSDAARLTVRVIGGAGDDVLRNDLPASARASVAFYDDRGAGRVEGSGATTVDRSSFDPPTPTTFADNNPPPPRDWGSDHSLFTPFAAWLSEIGPVIGGGPSSTRYGFRRFPFASRLTAVLQYAPLHTRFGVRTEARFVSTGSRSETRLAAWASQLHLTRFHGFGNDSPEGRDPAAFRVWAEQVGTSLFLWKSVGSRGAVELGPLVTYTDPQPLRAAATTGRPPGSRAFGLAGATLAASLDGRNAEAFVGRGFLLSAQAWAYPVTWGDTDGAFLRGALESYGYLPLPLPVRSVLALRAGTEAVAGDPPFQHAAQLGGGSSLRGYRTGRFTGDLAIHGGVELRSILGRVNLGVVRGELGTIGLVDAGRVYVSGDSPGGWHLGYGGGLWFGMFERTLAGYLLMARGEGWMLTGGFGVPF